MTDFQQRLEDLMQLVPGYAGYRAKEQRRDADKRLRTHLAQQFKGEQQALLRLAQQVAARGRLEYSDDIEAINQTLGYFIARLETAPRGYSGWFDDVHITETDLDQLYEFDAQLADSLPLLREQIGFVATTLDADEGIAEALATLHTFVDDLNRQFDTRQAFVNLGKHS